MHLKKGKHCYAGPHKITKKKNLIGGEAMQQKRDEKIANEKRDEGPLSPEEFHRRRRAEEEVELAKLRHLREEARKHEQLIRKYDIERSRAKETQHS